MTPEVAERLTIHEQDAVAIAPGIRRMPITGAHGLIALPGRRPAPVDGAERTLPALLRREAQRRRLLAGADVLGAAVALAVLNLAGGAQPATFAGLPLVVLLFKIAGLYDRDQLRLVRSTLDEAPMIVQLTGLYVLSVTILESILLGRTIDGVEIACLWGLTVLAIFGARVLARWLAGRITPAERCLLIGSEARSERVREKLRSSRARSTVVATLPLDDRDGGLGPVAMQRLVAELHVHRIIIAPATTDATGVTDLIRAAKAAGVRVSVLPRMLEVIGSAVEFEDVDGITVLGVRQFGLARSSRLLKRGFDLLVTSIGLLAVAPLIGLIAVAIRLDSRGPVFFRQVRVGRDGHHFRILKFRSMVADADLHKDGLRAFNEVGDGMFKLTSDPRVTRVGRVLRRTSLDELPQLFNVLRGEMSLVGPRPLVVDEDAQVSGLDRCRLHLTPGMTGPWQVLGTRVPMDEMVGIDYLYDSNWSLWADCKLLLRTARHVFRGANY
jgi:exopolysaccharide biosynthesis polyprenyl glycosylphosphotransferase